MKSRMPSLFLALLLVASLSRSRQEFVIPDDCTAFFAHCMHLLLPDSGSVLVAADEPMRVANGEHTVDCSGDSLQACLAVQTCLLMNTTALGDLQNDFCRQETDFNSFIECWSSDEFRDARTQCQENRSCVSEQVRCVANGVNVIPANVCPEEAKTIDVSRYICESFETGVCRSGN